MRATSGMDNPPSSTAVTTRTRNSVGYGAIRLLCNRSQAFASRYNQAALIAPFIFEGYCTTALFEAYVEHCLVPVLQPGQIVLYDNASFHQSAKAHQLIEAAGCTCKFLPPYSPDLNPIEHCWFPLKQSIRKQLPLHNRDLHKAIDAVFKQMA